MGKLIAIVGNTGCGKTTLAKLLCQDFAYTGFLEQHHERPFQGTFMQDRKTTAFANQVDFMLFRAEQEVAIRSTAVVGIQDGGLDQDFYIFTRLFHHNHYLSDSEFDLLARFFTLARRTLPLPDAMIRLVTPVPLLVERRRLRNRDLDIAQSADLPLIESLLADWFSGAYPLPPCLDVNTSDNDPTFAASLPRIGAYLESIL